MYQSYSARLFWNSRVQKLCVIPSTESDSPWAKS